MSKKFGIVAAAVIIVATVIGGTIGGAATRNRRVLSPQKTNAKAAAVDNIEGDYRAAIEMVSANYAGDIDYEKAT